MMGLESLLMLFLGRTNSVGLRVQESGQGIGLRVRASVF